MGALPAITAGVNLVGGYFQNQAAQSRANKQYALQKQLTDRQVALFDEMRKLAETGAANISPEKLIAERQNLLQKQYGNLMQNIGAGARVAGFKSGDTPVEQSLSVAGQKYLNDLANQQEQIRANAYAQQLGLLGAVNTGQLNPSLNLAAQQQQQAQSQMVNPFAAFQSLASSGLFAPQSKTQTTQPNVNTFANIPIIK